MPGIFVSHTHTDKPIADAFAEMVHTLFGERVNVAYSTKKELNGGIRPGEDWFHWIIEQVRQTDVAVILLTPASIQKPWILWEAGAVAGAAYATNADRARVYPMAFGIKTSNIPTPFSNTQIVNGTDTADVTKLVSDLIERFSSSYSIPEVVKIGARQEMASQKFVGEVTEVALRLPHLLTEATIQEWVLRLDELRDSKRYSEAKVIETWLDVAFGREADDKQRPLDVRIHRRLGDLYAKAGQAADAVRQFELARQLSPRDIYLLRRLGKAYLDQKDFSNTGEILKDIEKYDKRAFETNAENAALKARWYEEADNLADAREVLTLARSNLPTSYYLGDRLGQVLVKLQDRQRAQDVYLQVIATIKKLGERNVWTEATCLTAALVRDDIDGQANALDSLRKRRPSREDLDTIERGLRAMVEALGSGQGVLEELREIQNA